MSDASLTPGHQLALKFGIVKQIGLECRQDGRQHISWHGENRLEFLSSAGASKETDPIGRLAITSGAAPIGNERQLNPSAGHRCGADDRPVHIQMSVIRNLVVFAKHGPVHTEVVVPLPTLNLRNIVDEVVPVQWPIGRDILGRQEREVGVPR
jgi:hypothetical protein